jgi:hypothetical protein
MESSARGGEQSEDKGARKPAHIHRSLAREAPDSLIGEGLRRGRVSGSARGGGGAARVRRPGPMRGGAEKLPRTGFRLLGGREEKPSRPRETFRLAHQTGARRRMNRESP